jgi:hypothetical protein
MPAKVWVVSCPLPGERVSFHDKNLGLTASIEVADDEEVMLIFETDNPELAGRMVFFASFMARWKPGWGARDWESLMAWHVPLGKACPLGSMQALGGAILRISFGVVDPEIFSLGR